MPSSTRARSPVSPFSPLTIRSGTPLLPVVFPLLAKLGPEPLRFLEAALDVALSGDPTDPQNELTAQRKARAAVALLRLGKPEKVWPLFQPARDGRVRSYLSAVTWSNGKRPHRPRVGGTMTDRLTNHASPHFTHCEDVCGAAY